MRVAICDDNQQDIERIRRYTLRMIDYAVEYVFYTRPEELLRECADAELNITVRRSRQSGVARATCPD